MTDVLEATLRGPDRKALIERATVLTRTYFGIDCVSVSAGSVTVAGEADAPEFEAFFVGQEHHDVEWRSFGPGVCRGCGAKDWPSRPLKRAKAVPVVENRSQ